MTNKKERLKNTIDIVKKVLKEKENKSSNKELLKKLDKIEQKNQ